jgi:hypothetical protein
VPNVEHLEVVLNVEETSTQVIKFGAQGIVKIEEATEKATGLLTISNSVQDRKRSMSGDWLEVRHVQCYYWQGG